MTIKDKDQFKNLLANKTEQQLKNEYIEKSKEYQEDIVGREDIFDSQEYALLKMFGNAVTIYKSKNQENLDFKPLKLNTSNIPTVDDCK